MRIKTWHICLSGFLQKQGVMTGMMKLWRKLGFLRSPDTQVIIEPWKTNTWALAETIFMANETYDEERTEKGELWGVPEPPRIYIYAYSWGAGWTAKNLIKQLRNRGIPVECVVLADPVFRSPYMPDWLPFNPSTWFNGWWFKPYPVYIHDNVKRVIWFYQNSNLPRAHDVLPWNGKSQTGTIIETGILLNGVTHQYMDDDYRFHDQCLKVAKESIR